MREKKENYISYVDLLGIGDASIESTETYHASLVRFRQALHESVDRHLQDSDQVFAFSDCAFTSSFSLDRLGAFLNRLQYLLWEHRIFLKGAITVGSRGTFEYADGRGQSEKLNNARRKLLHGYWFSKEFVQPALIEKNLKGISILIDAKIRNDVWRNQCQVASAFYPSETNKRAVVFSDLRIPRSSLSSLQDVLRTYVLAAHNSRRVGRYYVPLVINWIMSHDYSSVSFSPKTGKWANAPLPLEQLMQNANIAAEVLRLVGGELIYFALLGKFLNECESPAAGERLLEIFASNKKLRLAVDSIPDEICSKEIRDKVTEKRLQYLFGAQGSKKTTKAS